MQDTNLDGAGGLRGRRRGRCLDGTDRGKGRGCHAETAEAAAGESGFVQ